MEETATNQFININPPQKNQSTSTALFLIFSLIFLAAASFGAGWGISIIKQRLQSAPAEIQKTPTTAVKEGWSLYEDPDNHFSISYPKDWQPTAHAKNDAAGVKLTNEAEVVELWLRFDKAMELSAEQKAGLSSTKTTNLKIGDQTAKVTTYEYKAGNFFEVIVIPATKEKPQVTFWLTASDSEAKDTDEQIAATFKY